MNITKEELAWALLHFAKASCRDEMCMCLGDRERFKCLHWATPEEVADDIFAAIKSDRVTAQEQQKNEE